jgi:ribosomal protein S18 acetylase RimI-like enzyme
MDPFISKRLVGDRHARLRQEAETARVLRDARRADLEVDIRVLGPSDADHIAHLFEQLSARSRFLRFLSPIHTLSAGVLHNLSHIDHQHHEAVGAFDNGVLVGAAHYFRSVDEPEHAEVAAEVSDSYQRRGIGTCLLRELAAIAHRRGITQVHADLVADNTAALGLLRKFGWPSKSDVVSGAIMVQATITSDC